MTLPATLYPSQLNSVSTTLNGSLAQAEHRHEGNREKGNNPVL